MVSRPGAHDRWTPWLTLNCCNRVRGTVPLAAMFILFDLVVHNPAHPETELNLSLLDMAAGFFGRFDYATNGAIPAALLSGFAHIANQFVKETRGQSDSSASRPRSGAGSGPASQNSLPNTPQQVQIIEPNNAGMWIK